MADTLLLFGANGQVGSELKHRLTAFGRVVALERAQADLSKPESLRAIVREVSPAIIVNAAAYTAVDKAESDAETARAVNGISPGVLAEEAATLDAILVHYSTDYVFSGTGDRAYVENDLPGPISVYGATKLAGEEAVLAANPRSLIFRTSWVYGAHGANFLKTMLRLAAANPAMRVVGDQFGVPTSAARISKVTLSVLSQMGSAMPDDSRWGVYHLASGGETNWRDYACHAIGEAASLGLPLEATPASIAAITTAEYPTPAARPANSRLDTAKLRQTFGVDLPDWKADMAPVIDAVVTELRSGSH